MNAMDLSPQNPGSFQPQAINVDQIGAPEILDSLADGAYITDCARRIVFWSQGAERITGWRAREVVGHFCSDNILVHIDKDGRQLCGQDLCPLHRAIVTGEVSSEPLLVFAQHKRGHRLPVEVSVAPLRDRGGVTVGGIEVFRDWTGVLEDLRRAKLIQDHALDCRPPSDPRVRFQVSYSPEQLVGGDFYRVEVLDPDHYAVMVADVMGHGLAAALYTMQLRSLWEECRQELSRPARFLGEINRRLHKLASADGYFATAVCLCLDALSGRVRYVRAGHPPPLLFRGGGGVEPLGSASPALGLLEDAAYAEAETCLRPGDSLLLFTDGATEITNARGEELGEGGFVKLMEGLRADGLETGSIEQKLLEFTNHIRLPDDLTLLIVHRCRVTGAGA